MAVFPDIKLELGFGRKLTWEQEFDEEIADFDAVSPAWDKEVDAVADFDAETDADGDLNDHADAAHDGAVGLKYTFDDNNAMYGVMNADAVNQTSGVVSFWFDPNTFGLDSGKIVRLTKAYDGAAADNWTLWLRNNAGTYQILQSYKNDAAAEQYGIYRDITDGWNHILWTWKRSSAGGADDGWSRLFIDGVLVNSITGADNDTKDWDSIIIGMDYTDSVGFGGDFYIDTIKLDPVGGPFVDKLAKKNGTYGLAIPITDTTPRYGAFTDPTAETSVTAECWLKTTQLTMATNDQFLAVQGDGIELAVVLKYTGSAYQIAGQYKTDGAVYPQFGATTVTNDWHHVRLVWAASTGAGNDDGYIYLYIDEELAGSVMGIDNDTMAIEEIDFGAVYLDTGTYGILYMDDCKWMPGGWTEVTEDVRAKDLIRIKYGIWGNKPKDRVARTGTCRFVLDNSESNSAGVEGYYSYGHLNAWSRFELGVGVRVSFSYSGIDKVKHFGRLVKADVVAGIKSSRKVKCLSHDWMAEATRQTIDLLTVQEDQRTDQCLTSLMANLDSQPAATSFSTGQETFEYFPDLTKDEKTTALRVMQNLAISEMGYIFVEGDGTLVFQDRHYRINHADIEFSVVEAYLYELKTRHVQDDLLDLVQVTVYPRDVGAANETLYSLVKSVQIGAGETKTFIARYTDPNEKTARISALDPALKDSEFSATETSDGGTLDGDLTLAASTYGGNSAKIVAENTGGSTGYITVLDIEGKAIRTYDPVTAEATDADADTNRELELRLIYQDSVLVAQDFADEILRTEIAEALRLESVGLYANTDATILTHVLELEPGQAVDVTEAMSSFSAASYFIHGVELLVQPRPNGQAILRCRWFLGKSGIGTYWFLGTSLLGVDTYLGF